MAKRKGPVIGLPGQSLSRSESGARSVFIPMSAPVFDLFAIYIDAYWRGVICSRSGSFLARESEVGVVTKVVEQGCSYCTYAKVRTSLALMLTRLEGSVLSSAEVTELQVHE